MIRKDPLSSYEDGAAAYNRADYATARRLWLPLAEAGNAEAQTMLGSEAARIHHPSRRRGCRMAARGARAAGGDTSDRISCRHVRERSGSAIGRLSPGVAANRLCRGAEPPHRISLGGGSL